MRSDLSDGAKLTKAKVARCLKRLAEKLHCRGNAAGAESWQRCCRRNGRERHFDCADAVTADIPHSYTEEILTLGRRVNIVMELRAAPPPRLRFSSEQFGPHLFFDPIHQLAIPVVEQDLIIRRSAMNAVGRGCKRDTPEVGVIPDGVAPVGRLHLLLYIRLIAWRKPTLGSSSGHNLHPERNLCRIGCAKLHGRVHHAHGQRLPPAWTRSIGVIREVSLTVEEIHAGLIQLHAHAAVTAIPLAVGGDVSECV